MKNKRVLLLGIYILLGPVAHAGTAYKWVDSAGNVQYSQTPPTTKAKITKTIAVADARHFYSNALDDSEAMQAQALKDAEQAHRDATEAASHSASDSSVDAAVAAANAANRAVEAASRATARASEQSRYASYYNSDKR